MRINTKVQSESLENYSNEGSTTYRPLMLPASIAFPIAGTASSPTISFDPIKSNFSAVKYFAKSAYADTRRSMGRKTHSTPANVTPRKINGATVVGKSILAARPQADTVPKYEC